MFTRAVARTMASFTIDGSVLEGGGQILRNSVAYSALLRKPVTIEKVRDGRNPPGLKNQHAAGINLAGNICSAALNGAEHGSRVVEFFPGHAGVIAGDYTADPKTAGSTTLLLQVSLPCLLFASKASTQTEVPDSESSPPTPAISTLTLRGGTNATQAPQIDYISQILYPFLRDRFHLNNLLLDIRKRGYFPRGGGEVFCSIPALPSGTSLPPITVLDRGEIVCIKGEAHIAGLPNKLVYAMRDSAVRVLRSSNVISDPSLIQITTYREPENRAVGAGAAITLWAETSTGCILGGSAISTRRQPAEEIGELAAMELVKQIEEGGCVDEYLQDQMLIFMALAKGKSQVRTGPLTLHTKTAIWVAGQLTDAKFEVEEEESGQCVITCNGIGLKNVVHGDEEGRIVSDT